MNDKLKEFIFLYMHYEYNCFAQLTNKDL